MSTKINLLLFVVEAFGHNRKIHKDIDRLYQTRKYDFYRAARESENYNHVIIKEGDIIREEYSKKALGIILYVDQTDDNEVKEKLFKIIQKGWPRAYMHILNHDEISMEKYFKSGFLAGNYKNDDDMNTEMLIIYWLSNMAGKKLLPEQMLQVAEQYFLGRLEHTDKDSKTRYRHKTMEADLLKETKKLKLRIYDKYGPVNSYDSIFFNRHDDLITVAEPISFIADAENISLSSLFNDVKFRKQDVEEVLGTYYMEHKNKNPGDAVKHLIWGLVLKGVLKAYKQVKQHYFENNKETVYIELESQEIQIKKLTTENALYKQKIDRLTEEARTARAEAEKAHRDRIRELEAEVGRLRSELAEERQKERELIALREFVFSLDRGHVPEIRDAVPDLTDTTGAIVGGHQRWQQRMKELLPGWVFISSEGFDVRVLDGVEVICFYTQHLGHALYYKAVGEARKRGLPIGYIGSINEELALREIAAIMGKARLT